MTASHAVAYAEHGWPVFPLWPISGHGCGCPDPKCDDAGKHPVARGWQNSIASVSAAQSMWRGPLAERGIGVACGPRLGAWVLDVDKGHGGLEALADLEAGYGPLPASCWRVQTGGGGLHIYFAWPADGPPVTNSDRGLPEGINVRGQGGFVVVPPSPHVSGHAYRWLVPPKHGQLLPAPDWLLELVHQPQRSLPAAGNGDQPTLIPGGKRYPALVRFCGLLRSAGLCEQALVECGLVFLKRQCDQVPTMDLSHAEKSIRDIARRYPPQVNR